jgi:hypothetical protein
VVVVAVAALLVMAALLADRDPRAEAARHGTGTTPATPSHTPATPSHTRATPGTVLTIGAARHGSVIRSGFLGLSLEYQTIEPYAGSDPAAINPVLVALIRNLFPGQRPELRIGGDSTDWAWWPTPAVRRPAGIRIDLTPTWLQVTDALASTLDARMILGIDLEADSGPLAAAEARAFITGVGAGRVQALELGNEPELYESFGWYRNAQGQAVPGRSPGWSFTRYVQDLSRIERALPPEAPLAGPAVGAPGWMRDVGRFIKAQPRARIVTLHRYPLQQCGLPAASKQYPSIAHILSPKASRGLADTVVRYVTDAHGHGDVIRIDEMNTVSCGGAPGVSNAFASALWSVDALFQMARVGVDGVNIHTFRGATYELFTFKRVNGTWTGFVAPQYYGMLMFAQAAPPGSRLLRVGGVSRSLRAWATRARDGRTRVVLINDDTRHARTVGVRAPVSGGPASLERLLAPSVHATSGVTLGGRSFGPETSTGRLAGASQVAVVRPLAHRYVVRLPPASAALVTLPMR